MSSSNARRARPQLERSGRGHPPRRVETARVPQEDLGTVLEFMRLMWSVDHELQSMSKRMLRRYGISGLQRLVIRIVGKRPGISAGDVARVLCVHPSTLTGPLERLAARGLVLRTRSVDDGRVALLELAPHGRAIDELRTGTIEAAIERVLESCDAETIAAGRRLLEAISVQLEGESSTFTRVSPKRSRLRGRAARRSE